jgi:hypothetical protein
MSLAISLMSLAIQAYQNRAYADAGTLFAAAMQSQDSATILNRFICPESPTPVCAPETSLVALADKEGTCVVGIEPVAPSAVHLNPNGLTGVETVVSSEHLSLAAIASTLAQAMSEEDDSEDVEAEDTESDGEVEDEPKDVEADEEFDESTSSATTTLVSAVSSPILVRSQE